jgi:hypothetical protein
MPPIATAFSDARSPADVLAATSTFLGGNGAVEGEAYGRLGITPPERFSSRDELDALIAHVRTALETLTMTDRDEERVHRLLGYLMLASFRAEQLS